jgi:hypothetical protein
MIFHDLRRSAVRNLVSAGVDQTVAMKITGHRTVSVFQRYRIVSDDDVRAALPLLAEQTAGQRSPPATSGASLPLTPPSARETAAPAAEVLTQPRFAVASVTRSRSTAWASRCAAVAVQPTSDPQIIRTLATDRSVNLAGQKPLALTWGRARAILSLGRELAEQLWPTFILR